ncbi:MAG: hypothetical protein JWM10_1924, partial [Myxococcaceae bacterium]|nr:hypothetical protein [Myxococcaceae bacterium]
MTDKFSRALDSFEARFSRGPADPTLRECTSCPYLVETVDSHGHCDECEQAREARDEAAANDCAACDGHGVVASGRMTNEADCDLDDCHACGGSGVTDVAQLESELGADDGFTAWCADRQLAAAEAMALEVDARDAALRAR